MINTLSLICYDVNRAKIKYSSIQCTQHVMCITNFAFYMYIIQKRILQNNDMNHVLTEDVIKNYLGTI